MLGRSDAPASSGSNASPPGGGGRALSKLSGARFEAPTPSLPEIRDSIDLSGRPEQTRLGDAVWLVRSGRVSMKPGSYRWSFAVRDDQTGITSYLTFDRALP